ncbi:cell division protein DivIVA, partial [Streptomyces nanshensis]
MFVFLLLSLVVVVAAVTLAVVGSGARPGEE